MANRKSGKNPRGPTVARSGVTEATRALAAATARVSDPAGRLAGEDAHHATSEDAAHWIAVYSELLSFKAELLDITARRRVTMSNDARGEAEADEVVISAQADKYTRRLREWRAHVDEATDSAGAPRLALFVEGRPRTFGHLLIDPWRRTVMNGGLPQRLTRTEWQLLRTFLEHPGETLSRAQLAAGVWTDGFESPYGKVEVYVSRLRRKLESALEGEPLIETVRGNGYRLMLPLETVHPVHGARGTPPNGGRALGPSRS